MQMDLNTSYKTLGIYPGSSVDEIKNAYKSQVKTFHPDLYEEKGSEKEYAKEKLILINLAYETIRSYIKDHPPSPPMGFNPEQYCQERYQFKNVVREESDDRKKRLPDTNQKMEDRISDMDQAYHLAKIRANERITNRIQQLTEAETEAKNYLKQMDYKYFGSGFYEIHDNKKSGLKKLKQIFLNLQGKAGY